MIEHTKSPDTINAESSSLVKVTKTTKSCGNAHPSVERKHGAEAALALAMHENSENHEFAVNTVTQFEYTGRSTKYVPVGKCPDRFVCVRSA